ncbi:MAG: hypothetical protein ABI625_23545 [bacterium]
MIRRACLLLLCAAPVLAQQAASATVVTPRAEAACSYEACALGIAPTWNGLDVVRGAHAETSASLGFFFPRDITPAFAGSDSAMTYAVRAVNVRRVAATLTDVGALVLGYAAIKQLRDGQLHNSDRVIAAVGAGAFAISVPLQFSADGYLSKAVWWHNSRYAR